MGSSCHDIPVFPLSLWRRCDSRISSEAGHLATSPDLIWPCKSKLFSTNTFVSWPRHPSPRTAPILWTTTSISPGSQGMTAQRRHRGTGSCLGNNRFSTTRNLPQTLRGAPSRSLQPSHPRRVIGLHEGQRMYAGVNLAARLTALRGGGISAYSVALV